MRGPAARLLLGVLPAVAASCIVLSISDVSRGVWIMQGASVVLMLLLAGGMMVLPRARGVPSATVASVLSAVGIGLCALPLAGAASGPERWITLGRLSLYVAPVVLPAMLAYAAVVVERGDRWARGVGMALGALALVLAVQPDLSQVLALTAAASLIVGRSGTGAHRARVYLPFAVAYLVAALQRDPLLPVSYVEQVLVVSWRHSPLVGAGVSAAAVALVLAIARTRIRGVARLHVVAAYYAVLFVCSLRDLTPAPIIGYGAGPIIGFGLLVGMVARWSDAPESSSPAIARAA